MNSVEYVLFFRFVILHLNIGTLSVIKVSSSIKPVHKNSSSLLGQEYVDHNINDWWSSIEGSMMMGPNDNVNINNGNRA
ncbi:hypothetical protein GCM10025767_25100 [Thalassotalea piscium]